MIQPDRGKWEVENADTLLTPVDALDEIWYMACSDAWGNLAPSLPALEEDRRLIRPRLYAAGSRRWFDSPLPVVCACPGQGRRDNAGGGPGAQGARGAGRSPSCASPILRCKLEKTSRPHLRSRPRRKRGPDVPKPAAVKKRDTAWENTIGSNCNVVELI